MAIRLPPRSWTSGKRFFPANRPPPESLIPKSPVTVNVPNALSQSVTAGATQETITAANMILTNLMFSIPAGVTGFIELDGERVHSSQDGEGETGGLQFGDDSTGRGRSVNQARVRFTNTTGAALDAKYVLHGVPQ